MAALMHHEKHDGTGYPLGRVSGKIHRIASIVSICDVYEAMTSDRVYRSMLSPFSVIKQFETDKFGVLDWGYVHTFLKKLADSFIGSKVILTDGREGKIVLINKQELSKPLIQSTDGFIDLNTDSLVDIARVV